MYAMYEHECTKEQKQLISIKYTKEIITILYGHENYRG